MTAPVPLEDVRRLILEAVQPLQPIELPLAEAYGCVAAAEVVSEYDLPPFSSAIVDGFAARSADVVAAGAQAPVALRLAGRVVPGRPPDVTVGWGEAVRVVAGAPLPAGADCVIAAGAAPSEGGAVRVVEPVSAGSNVRPAGEDLRAGSVLVPSGRRVSAPELGVLAGAGYGSVLAYPKLRVGVLSLGELVEPGRPTGFGQLRDQTSYLLLGSLRDAGAVPYRIGIVVDPRAHLRDAVVSNELRADAFLVAGGSLDDDRSVSDSLIGLGDVSVHRVAVYPAAELGFGTVGGKPFFSLPGDPTSAFVGFEAVVRPAVLRMMGRRDLYRPEVRATLDEPIEGPADVVLIVPARVSRREGAWRCAPTGPGGGVGLGAMIHANGLVVLDPGERPVAGAQVRVHILRPLER